MTVETFFVNFGHLADAPNGVQKLRELILQLAVQGKLVPQDPNDELASVLLKDRKGTKGKKLPAVTNVEEPYELPTGWEWVRLGELGQWAIGSGFPKKIQGHTDKPLLFCKVSDMNLPGNSKFIDVTNNTIDEEMAKAGKIKVHPSGTVVFPKIGGAIATNKRRVLVKPTAIDNNCLGVIPAGLCESDWLFLLLTSIDLTQYQSGTSVPALSQKTLGLIVTGVPPLEEQKRIVAKVDQLMALCDELEARQQKQQQVRMRLNNAALDALLTAREPDEFADHWQRISTNFDLLFDHPATIAKLRAAILQLAVQGKLVPQDPNDEPASVLLERIRTERKIMVKAGKASKEKQLPPVDTAEIDFEVPRGWQAVRFGSVCDSRLGKMLDKSKNKGSLYPYLRNTNVQWLRFELDDLKEMRFEDGELVEFEVRHGDLLVCEGGEPGRCAIWSDRGNAVFFQKALHRVRPFPGVNNWFLLYRLWGSAQSGELANYFTGATIKHLTGKSLGLFPIGLPPLEEQKRIVAKVDQLMALCDELEAKLCQAQQRSEKLMEATVRQLLVA